MDKENRCFRRVVSSIHDAEFVGRNGVTVLGLGVTCKLSSWKSSRMWRNERGRDAGLIRITRRVRPPVY
jgi:hypothetical protein